MDNTIVSIHANIVDECGRLHLQIRVDCIRTELFSVADYISKTSGFTAAELFYIHRERYCKFCSLLVTCFIINIQLNILNGTL